MHLSVSPFCMMLQKETINPGSVSKGGNLTGQVWKTTIKCYYIIYIFLQLLTLFIFFQIQIKNMLLLNFCHNNTSFINYVIGLTGVWQWVPVNILGLNSSLVRALARYARDHGFETRLRHDFSAPVTILFIQVKNQEIRIGI